MLYFLLLIAAVTLITAALRRAQLLAVCPICAGVVVAWLGGLIALYSGAAWANPLLIAILLGASLGALAEKYGPKFGLVWKTILVLLGLPIIYLLVNKNLWPALGLLVLLGLFTLSYKKRLRNTPRQPSKDLFADCC